MAHWYDQEGNFHDDDDPNSYDPTKVPYEQRVIPETLVQAWVRAHGETETR